MNLTNFEEYFDDAILRRGFAYYREDRVDEPEFDGDEWVAQVEGSEDYTVTVRLSDKGEILTTSCDCPYDWGEYCKHQAAVLYSLRENMRNHSKKQNKRKSLADILNQQERSALASILLEYAAQDRKIKADLLLRFSEKQDVAKRARALIQSTVSNTMHSDFVEYGDVAEAAEGAQKVLELAEGMDSNTQAVTRVSLYLIVLEEMINLLDCCDDSDGIVGGAIEESMAQLSEITSAMVENHSDSEKVFDLIFQHTQDSRYDGWNDWRCDLLQACVSLCTQPELRKRLCDYLDSLASGKADNQYLVEQVQCIAYKLTAQFDGQDAALSYRESHLENHTFRKAAIHDAFEQREFDRALKLCLDGETSDKDFAGLLSEWKHLRYTVYEAKGDIAGQMMLGETLALDGDFDIFLKLKVLYAPNEWQPVLERLLSTLKGKRSGYGDIYVRILIHENRRQELLEYCYHYPSSIMELSTHLLPEYKDEVGKIFVQYIWNEMKLASDRNRYRQIAQIISRYKRECGAVAAKAIRDELLEKYPKRPALADELKRLEV